MLTAKQTAVIADSLFKFDPDLNPDGTVAQNLDAIRSNIASPDAGGCPKVSLGQGALDIDFGSACTLPNGVVASGKLTLHMSKADATRTLTLSMTFVGLVVNGFDVDGSTSFSTSTGSSFDVTLDLKHAGASVSAMLNVARAAQGITVDGSATLTPAGTTTSTSATLKGVAFEPTDCYPNAGSLAMSSGAVSGTITFSASTATTGQATLSAGPASSCFALPSYGKCVATPCPAKG